MLIFNALAAQLPSFAHLPLLVAPDGTKLSKRRHGPIVSVTSYRDAGFLAATFINFLCLLGWSPKNDREQMSLAELQELFTLEGINRANAVVNFKEPAPTPEEMFDPKAVWLNAEHIRALPVEELGAQLLPIVRGAGHNLTEAQMLRITPLIRERIKLLCDVLTAADFFFLDRVGAADQFHTLRRDGAEDPDAKARARDGIVECIQDTRRDRFVLGVQWHPELSWQDDQLSREIFRSFVDRCRKPN